MNFFDGKINVKKPQMHPLFATNDSKFSLIQPSKKT